MDAGYAAHANTGSAPGKFIAGMTVREVAADASDSRRFYDAAVQGSTADELEAAALAETRRVFGEDAHLVITDPYAVTPVYDYREDNVAGRRLGIQATIRVRESRS